MKELNMSWSEIKTTPTVELQGLMKGFENYNLIHAFDGYDAKDVATMAKDKPHVREQYSKSQRVKEEFDYKLGKKRKVQSFTQLVN
tara:strand:+ start:1168 stop:1425 length:258 start_codon:yes stop_codon:yes gene_type:complete